METINSMHCDLAVSKEDMVRWFYENEDEDFFRYIHKSGGGKEKCIRATVDTMEPSSQMFLVYCNDELAAFFVKYEHTDGRLAMEGFHVAKDFRNRVFLTQFWKMVRRMFVHEFHAGIYCKNEPAIRCLVKAGFSVSTIALVHNQVFIILKS